MVAQSNTIPLMVRIPADVKEYLVQQCEKYGSSQNSEIIRSVRERMEREPAAVTPAKDKTAAA